MDVLTGYFVPVITLLAILTWVIWLALGLSGILPQSYLDIPIGGWREHSIVMSAIHCCTDMLASLSQLFGRLNSL